MKELTAIRCDYPDCNELDVQVGRGVLRRLDRSCNGLFRRVKAGETPGFSKFEGLVTVSDLVVDGRQWLMIGAAAVS